MSAPFFTGPARVVRFSGESEAEFMERFVERLYLRACSQFCLIRDQAKPSEHGQLPLFVDTERLDLWSDIVDAVEAEHDRLLVIVSG